MIQQEFNTQIFRTCAQWDSGLTYRLEKLAGGGIKLFSTPTFTRWIQKEKGIKNPEILAVDECRLIYYIEEGTSKLYRYDKETRYLEHLPCIIGRGREPGEIEEPRRILFDKFTMWVMDARRIQAFSRDNHQIRYIIDDLEKPVDMGLDGSGYIYVIDKKENHNFKIITYGSNGQNIDKVFDVNCLEDPVGLAVGGDNSIYILDREPNRFLRLAGGKCSGPFGDFSKINDKPTYIVIDTKGNIFVLDEKGSIHQFDPDGGYQGKINIPDSRDPVRGIAVDSYGDLYASGEKGIALLVTQQKYTREQGIYYSKTLDSGIQECQWHRLALDADIPQKSILEIYFYCSDDTKLKEEIDDLIGSDRKTTQEKASILDKKFQWTGPERYFSSEEIILNNEKNPPGTKPEETKTRNILFRGKGGRYMWLKIVLLTFDDNVRPQIRGMKVFYPRISYLRYLPAIYQEDPSSREFLERFLSIFETVFDDLETEISQVFKYFDPDTAPENFLSWLASWMNLALEEEWEEEKKREFIRQASFLHRFKGTPSGIEKLVEIYTGKKPIILENSKTVKPLVLGGKSGFILGMNSLLIRTPVRGFRLGYDSILGKTMLRDVVQVPEDPFLPAAHSFTVLLDLSSEEFARFGEGLERALNDEKPAHTSFNLRIINEMSIGSGTYVGINTRIGGYKPIYLKREIRGRAARESADNTIGYGVLATGEKQGSRVERRSRLGYDVNLV